MSLQLIRRQVGKAHGKSVSAPYRLNTPSSLDLVSPVSSTPTIYTVPASTTVVVLAVRIRCTAVTGTVTTVAECGVGIAANEDDIYAQQPLYGLAAANDLWVFPEGGTGVVATAAQEIKLGIDVNAAGASVQTVEVDVIGYEV